MLNFHNSFRFGVQYVGRKNYDTFVLITVISSLIREITISIILTCKAVNYTRLIDVGYQF